jgi:hypothetical protein
MNMTLDDAIALLENSIPVLRDFDEDEREALDMLIDAAHRQRAGRAI